MILTRSIIARLNAARSERQRKQAVRERLEATMKPNPRYARNCAAQLPLERRKRFLANLADMGMVV